MGSIDAAFVQRGIAETGMEVVKVGGPVYRIGVGGGAASSVEIQGGDEQSESLNFNAVQRGDPEMEQKMNRVIRACIENKENPIHAIHDQGAGETVTCSRRLPNRKARLFMQRTSLWAIQQSTLSNFGG